MASASMNPAVSATAARGVQTCGSSNVLGASWVTTVQTAIAAASVVTPGIGAPPWYENIRARRVPAMAKDVDRKRTQPTTTRRNVPVRRSAIGEGVPCRAEPPVGGEEEAVVGTPGDERPGGTVPEPPEQHGQQEVAIDPPPVSPSGT